MRIEEWFCPQNREDCKAWLHLERTGTWPEGFVPEDTVFPLAWQVILAYKMAHLWAKEIAGDGRE